MKQREELPRRKDGQKLYPTCSWEKNQHKLYDMLNLAKLHAEETHNEIDYEEVDRIEYLIGEFDACVIDGTAYVAWEDSLAIKDLIAEYGMRKSDKLIQEVDRADVPTWMSWEEYEGGENV